MENEKNTTQSIFILLDTLETETSVPGQTPKMQKHTLPREMFPSSKQFEDENSLVEWAKETGCLHSVMQKGIQKHLIDCRARFKACKKTETWSNEMGQKQVDDFKWEVMTRPQAKATVSDIQAQANIKAGMVMVSVLRSQGKSDEEIRTLLAMVYPNEISQIMA